MLFFLFGPRSILWSHWLLLFWTSCVLPHGFQIQSGYLACTLSCLCAVILKVTAGVTPAFSTNRGVHCISVYTAWLARLLSHALGFEPPTQWWAAQWCVTKSDALPTELFRRPCKNACSYAYSYLLGECLFECLHVCLYLLVAHLLAQLLELAGMFSLPNNFQLYLKCHILCL